MIYTRSHAGPDDREVQADRHGARGGDFLCCVCIYIYIHTYVYVCIYI